MGTRIDTGRTTWALILITVGVIFLGQQSGWGWRWGMDRLWPLVLIAIGVGHLPERRADGRWAPASGLWWITLGAIFLLTENDVLTWGTAWPLFIVAMGVWILFGEGAVVFGYHAGRRGWSRRRRRMQDDGTPQAPTGGFHD